MSIGRILFLAIFLFSTSTILGVSSWLEKLINEPLTGLNTLNSEQFQQLALEENYKKDLLKLLNQYSSGQTSDADLEKELLALRVPRLYQDLHFQLALAIAELNRPTFNPLEIRKKLETLRDSYSWLATNLAIFIANNF